MQINTYHIHIGGLVQGVGFRPFACRMARLFKINGWVSNTNNGVHITCTASTKAVEDFYHALINEAPANAIITHHQMQETSAAYFADFIIKQSSNEANPDLLLTPDIAICSTCSQELGTLKNKRQQYPFITCLHCGPRYSIITALPYDRARTTMSFLQMCTSCLAEYNNIENRRHYSQTNSCPQCAIPMYFYSAAKKCISTQAGEIINLCMEELNLGSIIAVKGTGGYLLLCDASNLKTIAALRLRKHRPAKPFALLYADIKMADTDVQLRSVEINALKDKAAPIVLCPLKFTKEKSIFSEAIAPGLDKIGIMLPNSPLLLLLATTFAKPLIATSANINASPIIYKDKDAVENLFELADFVLAYNRTIVTPQDDSVMQFTDAGQKIILRRSRGLAPNYFPHSMPLVKETVLAMGAELKSAFALQHQKNIYISQYLGNQATLESQTCFKETLQHLTVIIKAAPQNILIDTHPGYFVSQFGIEMAEEKNIPVTAIQHHKAHFAAVLAENNLLQTKEKVLGFIWDGTGYGDDGQVWGSEVFIFENTEMNRATHLLYFPQLLGDKMSKEPRLSALSLLKNSPGKQFIIEKYFTKTAWQYYQQLIEQPTQLSTSSMGRFLDGIAAILGIRLYNTYEGEAAMQLEVLARSCKQKPTGCYAIPLLATGLDWNPLITALTEDYLNKKDCAAIAWKVFFSLAKMVEAVSEYFKIDRIAFSGGVFQNALLNDLLVTLLQHKRTLYFHRQLSPNDECISFGQLACFNLQQAAKQSIKKRIESVAV